MSETKNILDSRALMAVSNGPPCRQTMIDAYNIVQLRLSLSGEANTKVGHMMYLYAEKEKNVLGADTETAIKLADGIDAELRARAVETKDWTL